MEKGSLVTEEQLETLQQAQKTLTDIAERALEIGRGLPENRTRAWNHSVGIRGAIIDNVRFDISRLVAELVEVEQEFEI